MAKRNGGDLTVLHQNARLTAEHNDNGSIHLMLAAGQMFQHPAGVSSVGGLFQHSFAQRDDGVGADYQPSRVRRRYVEGLEPRVGGSRHLRRNRRASRRFGVADGRLEGNATKPENFLPAR